MITPDINLAVARQSLFLQQSTGLVDSINKSHPDIWLLYKTLKALDWDENEFDYSQCLNDFKTCGDTIYSAMLKTIAWQWEADSIAANNFISIIAPFISSTELWAAYSELAANENVHGLTYAEIVRCSFDNPDEIMKLVLEEKEALKRLATVSEVFRETKQVAGKLMLEAYYTERDYPYEVVLKFVSTVLIMERMSFMPSFAITFAIVETGMFIMIGKAVQKIMTDEFQIHINMHKAVIQNELSTPKGLEIWERSVKSQVTKVLNETEESELNWSDYVLPPEKELLGLTNSSLKDWVLFHSGDLRVFFGIENNGQKVVNSNPLPYMDKWININQEQGSPMEARGANYLLGSVIDDLGDRIIDVDF